MLSERLSSRTSFQLEDEVLDTSEPLFGSIRTPNIIVFILVLYANRVEGKPWTLPNLNLEVSNGTIFSNISFIPNIWKLN